MFLKGIKEIKQFFSLPLIEVMKFWLWLRLIESKILSWWASYSSRLGNIFSTNWSKLGSGLNDLLETNFFRQVGHSLFPDLKAVTMHSAQNLWNKVVKLNKNLLSRQERSICFGQTLKFRCAEMHFSSIYKFSIKTSFVEKSITYADIF